MVTFTLTGPSNCDVNKSCGPWTLSADAPFLSKGFLLSVCCGSVAGFATPAQRNFSFASPIDLHATPFTFNLNFLETPRCTAAQGCSCDGWDTDLPPSLVVPALGQSISVTVGAAICDQFGGRPPGAFTNTLSLGITNLPLVFTFPSSCNSSSLCTFRISSTVDLTVNTLALFFFKKGRPITSGIFTAVPFSPPIDLKTSPVTISEIFNNIDPQGLVLPPCGSSDTISTAVTINGSLPILGPDFTLSSTGITCTQVVMEQVQTTQDIIGPCVGVDGTVGVQGVLDTVGFLGLLTVFQGATILFGLIDTPTGTFYEYVIGTTTSTIGLTPGGRFGAKFKISTNPNVAALVPPGGTRAMQLVAIYPGDATHTSVMASTPLVVQSDNIATLCFTGTLVAQELMINPLPTTVTEVHQLAAVFTTSILSSNIPAKASDLIASTKTAIINSGAVPLDVAVYRGPDLALLSIFGLTIGTVPTLIVVAHAYGSPVAPLVIILAIIAALIVLGIIVYIISQQWSDILRSAFMFCQNNPQLCATAAATAQIAAVALLVGVAGVVGFFAYREIRKGGGLRGLLRG